MIVVKDVHKRYKTRHGMGPWVLRGVSFVIPKNVNVGLIGANGAGKSTLLRIIGGVDQPTRGTVERHCRVSWPMGLAGGLHRLMTGRQNAKFACRIHGHEGDVGARIAAIQDFAEIGTAFDEPIATYSSGMKARLKFAISVAFDFDVYISDELTAVGDRAFKQKAKQTFADLVDRAGLIMVSHQDGVLQEFCQAGVLLENGGAQWYDDINEAMKIYEASQDASGYKPMARGWRSSNTVSPDLFQLLEQGKAGNPALVDHRTGKRLIGEARERGVELLSARQLSKQGLELPSDAMPLLRKHTRVGSGKIVDFYDLSELNMAPEKKE